MGKIKSVTNKELRTTIAIQGAREHNLKDISLEIPRDRLVVITGVSGSGKSSLAFDTIYAEGQRRYMESLSSFVRGFITQVAKPNVDFMFGLSPVISIEQKTTSKNPRSTVGTMTDISNYLNLLFATMGTAHCPYCKTPIPIRSKNQILDILLALPEGTKIELRVPVFKIYGEDYNFLFTEVRRKGYKRLLIDGKPIDISEEVEIDETLDHRMEVIVDQFVIKPDIDRELLSGIENALLLGDTFLSVHIVDSRAVSQKFNSMFGCTKHNMTMGEMTPVHFMFNEPLGACRTCLGLGTYKKVHPDLLVPDKNRSIREGCFVRAACNYNPDSGDGRLLYSLSKKYGFSLDTPFKDLPDRIVDILLNGTQGEKFTLMLPPEAKARRDPKSAEAWIKKLIGKPWGFNGIAGRIENHYRHYRRKEVAHSGMEAWLEKVMVDSPCPDCKGTRLKQTRNLVTIDGKSISDFGEINFDELRKYLNTIKPGRNRQASQQILNEIKARLDLLLGIGLDYLNFNRRSGTLSGGEAQRIRLSTQIGSGLMGMLYVLDEPSIGLHPRDNEKMISTLRRLRDLGNTVIVVEHDEETIRAADFLVEMGPGPGVHGGEVVVQGSMEDILRCKDSPTGQYLSGRKRIHIPPSRRRSNGKSVVIRGASENNLKHIDVEIPLGLFVCVTGASGSGKSTLINDILFRKLYNILVDSRTLFGKHDRIDGAEEISRVIEIDQTAIGRNSRSNPATYVGFYDDIRMLFANTKESKKRGYKPGRFSFNVAGGRCPECSGEGTISTQLYFMPDVESICESCKGARFNADTLEITYCDKNIAEVLSMSIEEGVTFFRDQPTIASKVNVLNELGLGYLTLGQSATTLSGGEAQRVKLATELSKLRRGGHTLYILDEPTTGLHLADITRLLECLNRLVDAGHTVLVIEHHLDVIKIADHVIDLGPEGGHSGGEVIGCGTPEEIARCKRSYTGRFLKERL